MQTHRKLVIFIALLFAWASWTYAKQGPGKAKREITLINLEYKGSKIWLPATIVVKKGELVKLTLVNKTPSGVHGFAIDEFKVKVHVAGDKNQEVEFVADQAGLFRTYCDMHPAHIGGQILVLE